jgi:hypothetical protein
VGFVAFVARRDAIEKGVGGGKPSILVEDDVLGIREAGYS